MGVDLDIGIQRFEENEYISDWLAFDRERNLFSQIMRLNVHSLPYPLRGRGTKETTEDAYSNLITYLHPSQFSAVKAEYPYNQAILDFISKVDNDFTIILYWH